MMAYEEHNKPRIENTPFSAFLMSNKSSVSTGGCNNLVNSKKEQFSHKRTHYAGKVSHSVSFLYLNEICVIVLHACLSRFGLCQNLWTFEPNNAVVALAA